MTLEVVRGAGDISPDTEYLSCDWIEGGIAFNRRSLHVCLIVHHRAGMPFLTDYNGGTVPLEAVLTMRRQIREGNRRGEIHAACMGCAHLKKRVWPEPKYPIEIVGIAHYSHCNIECSYCFLQTQDPASFAAGYRPYRLLPTIQSMIADGTLAPNAIVDWGGGEPTVYREFDEIFEALLAHGTFHYIHSNGTRLPESIRRTSAPERVHVICSVDAGFPETYLQLKGRDYLELVWRNLEEYIRLGVHVTPKYIVKSENCADAELEAFVARAVQIGARELILDIDYDYPQPTPDVIVGLAQLKHLALRAGLHARFGFTGDNFAAENDVVSRVMTALQAKQIAAIRQSVSERQYTPHESIDVTVEEIMRTLEEHCAVKDREIVHLAGALRTLEEHCAVKDREIVHLADALRILEEHCAVKDREIVHLADALRTLEEHCAVKDREIVRLAGALGICYRPRVLLPALARALLARLRQRIGRINGLITPSLRPRALQAPPPLATPHPEL